MLLENIQIYNWRFNWKLFQIKSLFLQNIADFKKNMARDKYHYHVREALIKDGWTITDDPYYIITPGLSYPVDLGAEKIIGATKGNKKIAVEIFTPTLKKNKTQRVVL